MSDYSFIFNAHPSFIETMYKSYQNDPEAIEISWRTFFEGFDFALNKNGAASNGTSAQTNISEKEFLVYGMIDGFRRRGHLLSKTNPIRERRDRRPKLNLPDYGLSEADLGQRFLAGREIGLDNATLKEIIERLHDIYCGSIGFEFAYIEDLDTYLWLLERIEGRKAKDFGLAIEKKKRILEKLNGAVLFERFLHTKYVGQKRFSLEGGETTIAALDAIINKVSELGTEEVVIGMAHRGRLNVLANIMGKTYEQIFNEFEGVQPELAFGDGDVKYHLGFSSQVKMPSGKTVDLKLAPNPSHLESVNSVVEGFTRAKADILFNSDYDKVLPIAIHGDAAVVGQGVVYETLQMSKLEGYYTGGTIHFVINNQIGFTTDFEDARSSTYCTASANTVQAPVFHVNGDDPEAVVFVAELAAEYRQKFNTDVFIDMVCYRRHGHNEGDDPQFTQPIMYKAIANHPNPRDLYSEKLIASGTLEAELAQKMNDEFWDNLQDRLKSVKEKPLPYKYQAVEKAWMKLKFTTDSKDFEKSPNTAIDKKVFDQVLKHMHEIPDNFKPLRKWNRLLKSKAKLIAADTLDWGIAELLAYGSILLEGKDVRMSGQDVRRGTFSHRHAVLYDEETNAQYNRLSGMSDKQGELRIFNSLLSEFAVMGFEFGYSMASPDSLVIWEGQFGDFANGAQVMVDQYLSSCESKWHRMSGLVLLLPHGYEGQGPEHSSARWERYLQLCAEKNMVVANLTTPANLFHALRRQLQWDFRKPLVIMSPKSLLRHPKCVSSSADFIKGNFQELIDDAAIGASKKKAGEVKRVLLCSGKVYYDLLAGKEANKRNDVAIVRIEQLYPFPQKQLDKVIKKYAHAEFVWVQEEPMNMGPWYYILSRQISVPLTLVSRKASASPATGYKKVHDKEQADLVKQALG